MSGIYWSLTALELLGARVDDFMPEDELVAWVLDCRNADGSFSPCPGHDGNLLSTLSAVQILAILGRLRDVAADEIAGCAPQSVPHASRAEVYGPQALVITAATSCRLCGHRALMQAGDGLRRFLGPPTDAARALARTPLVGPRRLRFAAAAQWVLQRRPVGRSRRSLHVQRTQLLCGDLPTALP